MKVLPVIVIAILMIADYTLTVLGVKLANVKYRQHFKAVTYELNPLWQKTLEKPRYVNLRHLIIVALITGYLLLADYILPEPYDAFMTAAYGAITIPFLTIIGRHITNILMFSYLIAYPKEVQGEISTSYAYLNKASQFSMLSYTFIFITLYFYTKSLFILGGVIGCTILFLAHFFWKRRLARNIQKER